MRKRRFPLESVTSWLEVENDGSMVEEGEVGYSRSSPTFGVHRPLTQLQYSAFETLMLVYGGCFVGPEDRATTPSLLRRVQEVLRGIAHGLDGPWRMRRNSPRYQGRKNMHSLVHQIATECLCVVGTLLAVAEAAVRGHKGSVLKELTMPWERHLLIKRGNSLCWFFLITVCGNN